jgi:hypothetical protein
MEMHCVISQKTVDLTLWNLRILNYQEGKNYVILVYEIVWFRSWLPAFLKDPTASICSTEIKLDVAFSFETMLTTYSITLCHNPEGHNRYREVSISNNFEWISYKRRKMYNELAYAGFWQLYEHCGSIEGWDGREDAAHTEEARSAC